MKKVLFSLLILFSTLFAAVDYTVMSTEELMAMVGYVPPENQKAFLKEINARIRSMSEKEKKIYKQNIEKLRKMKK
ncbi:MAG: DUF1104 domain-containing protein [Sulfurospirillaceae bacterium]|nr:DUF1104 domain-containing protein [Sulfurospirillaceae bacterium]